MTPEQKAKAAATRARNAAIKKRVDDARAVKMATIAALTERLAKIEATANDIRANEHVRTTAKEMAARLRVKIMEVRSPYDPPPIPTQLFPKQNRRGWTIDLRHRLTGQAS